VILLRVLRRIIVLVVIPIVGYLIGATIVFHFSNQYGDEYPDGPSMDSATYAVATSCEQQGPVSTHGFGHWWRCQADVHWQGNGATSEPRTADFLTPADIGRPVQVAGTRRNQGIKRAATQPYQWVGIVIIIPFAVLWLRLVARFARFGVPGGRLHPAAERVMNLVTSERMRPPGVSVTGVHRWWLSDRKLTLVMAVLGFGGAFGTVQGLAGSTDLLVGGVVSLMAFVILFGAWAWSWVVSSGLTIAPEGIFWADSRKSGLVTWEELREVHVSPRPTGTLELEYVISVDPLGADARPLPGLYSSGSVAEIERAMLRFSPDSVGWRGTR
jgi:hypothetical protein